MKTKTRDLQSMFDPYCRNNYFYGKMLDVENLVLEQRYHTRFRSLLNRLVTGHGVVCGLNLEKTGSNTITVKQGVAIDRYGREIVVSKDVEIDPRQLTDEDGNPTGDQVANAEVQICLRYAELLVDPVPVLVPECSTPGDCAPGTICESYCIVVREPQPSLEPLPCDFDFSAGTLQGQLCGRVSEPCPENNKDTCLSLALVALDGNGEIAGLDPCFSRQVVYSNPLLFELILCLEERLADISSLVFLRYVSGDSQSGSPGDVLPLAVEVVDLFGGPVQGVSVEFSVEGGGSVNPNPEQTDAQGRAEIEWTLGSSTPQRVVAKTEDSAFIVTFEATLV
jgi:hypothetical protein